MDILSTLPAYPTGPVVVAPGQAVPATWLQTCRFEGQGGWLSFNDRTGRWNVWVNTNERRRAGKLRYVAASFESYEAAKAGGVVILPRR